MQACSLLLGCPWEFDTDVVHHGRANKYTLMHKGKKITLLPLTPNEIVRCDRAIAETAKRESEIQHDQTTPPLSSNALVCRQVSFSVDEITTPLPHAVTNLLQEFKDIFSYRDTPGVATFEWN
jgi:hypothetical protein